MASGHVNRIYRPNTWPHRPILQNVKKDSCQLGADGAMSDLSPLCAPKRTSADHSEFVGLLP